MFLLCQSNFNVLVTISLQCALRGTILHDTVWNLNQKMTERHRELVLRAADSRSGGDLPRHGSAAFGAGLTRWADSTFSPLLRDFDEDEGVGVDAESGGGLE